MKAIPGEYIVHSKPKQMGSTICQICGTPCNSPMRPYATQQNVYYIPIPICEPCSDEDPKRIDELDRELKALVHLMDQKGAAK